MLRKMPRTSFTALSLLACFIVLGCNSQATPRPAQSAQTQPGPAPDTAAVAEQLRTIAAAGTLADLHAPNFTDYRLHVQHMYEAVNYAPVWVRGGR